MTTGRDEFKEVAPPSTAKRREKALQALTGSGRARAPTSDLYSGCPTQFNQEEA